VTNFWHEPAVVFSCPHFPQINIPFLGNMRDLQDGQNIFESPGIVDKITVYIFFVSTIQRAMGPGRDMPGDTLHQYSDGNRAFQMYSQPWESSSFSAGDALGFVVFDERAIRPEAGPLFFCLTFFSTLLCSLSSSLTL